MVGKIKEAPHRFFFNERQLTVDADGTFFVAFDRDAPGQANLQILLPDGTEIARQIQISRRDWNIERVNIARRGGATNEAFMARRAPELDAIRAAREISSGSKRVETTIYLANSRQNFRTFWGAAYLSRRAGQLSFWARHCAGGWRTFSSACRWNGSSGRGKFFSRRETLNY